MFKNVFFGLITLWMFSCNDTTLRCSFDLTDELFLAKINSSFNADGYFKIASYESNNMMQLFVFDSQIDVDKKLNDQVEVLNSPNVFTAQTIDCLHQFGNYKGKGVIMKGVYEGGVVRGTITVFSFGKEDKGFLSIRQIIEKSDTADFNLVEKSFMLK